MFEYLMPNLVIKEYKESVFADSSRAAVLQQIRYAAKKEYHGVYLNRSIIGLI